MRNVFLIYHRTLFSNILVFSVKVYWKITLQRSSTFMIKTEIYGKLASPFPSQNTQKMNHSGLAPLWCVSVRFLQMESQRCTWTVPAVALLERPHSASQRQAVGVGPGLLPHGSQRSSRTQGSRPPFPSRVPKLMTYLRRGWSVPTKQQNAFCLPAPGSVHAWLLALVGGLHHAEVPHFIHGSAAGERQSGPHICLGPGSVLLLPPQDAMRSTSNPVFCWIWGGITCRKLNHLKLSFLWVRSKNFV